MLMMLCYTSGSILAENGTTDAACLRAGRFIYTECKLHFHLKTSVRLDSFAVCI